MKKWIYILWLVLPFSSFAQYKNSSRFLYGKSRSTVPYYLSLQTGITSNNYVFNKDFNTYGSGFAWGFSFEKPLGYRPALALTMRTMGKYKSSVLNSSNLNTDIIAQNTNIELTSSLDVSLNYSYMIYDWYGWQYRLGVGIGFVNNTIDVRDTALHTVKTSTPIVPLQISTTRVLKKRWEMEFGYRYYLGLDNKIEGIAYNNTLDKYSFLYVALKYRLGEKDFRFKRSDTCPTPAQ